MMPQNLCLAAAICIFLTLAPSCKKDKGEEKTTCSSTVYGYNTTGTIASTLSPTATATFGSIDLTSVSGPATGTLSNSVYSNQGAFNTDDNCYYVFKYYNSGFTSTLIKISTSGAATIYTSTDTLRREGLVYNQITNKLYCLLGNDGGPANIAEVTISGSAFTTTAVGTTAGIAASASPASSTVDNSTGKMYFALMKHAPEQYSVESYVPGSGSTTVLTTGADMRIMGLRFNKNDNMLYAISEDYSSGTATDNFVKIAPSSGSMSTLSTLSFEINNELYTAAFDACSNRYVFYTLSGAGWSTRVVKQINTSGTVVQSDIVPCMYQGFDVAY